MKSRHPVPHKLIFSIFLLSATLFAWGSFLLFRFIGGKDLSTIKLFSSKIPTATQSTSIDMEYIEISPESAILPWNGSDRVTLLLLGLDHRDWEIGSTSSRSDTMILLTIDPVSMTAGVLSIPRDLWAVIPGFNPGKINTAYYYGDAYKLPGGGPALAMRTVEQTIGVPIDYYAQIEFETFERFVDLIGGVKIDIPEQITVDPLGPRQPVTIEAGRQVLPGYLVLAYARARHTPGGDFSRAERQQSVIMAIRDRLLDRGKFNQLVDNAPEIYSELSSGINTNLSLNDAVRLALLAVQIKEEDIKRGVINEKYVTFGRSPDDLAILIPIPDKIRLLRDEIFGGSGLFSPKFIASDQVRMQMEAASISVQNGTSDLMIAQQTADFFKDLGAIIVDISKAEQNYSNTIFIDHTGNPYTIQYLSRLLNIDSQQIYHRFDPTYKYDIEIKLGRDWLNNNTLPIK